MAITPHYNNAGALEKVEFAGTTYVEHLAYNAKGQRLLAVFGNDTMTRYAYDAQTFRLKRQRTETYTNPTTWTFEGAGSVIQDTAYNYDLGGNIVKTIEARTDAGYGSSLSGSQGPTPDQLVRDFEYDPIYRLIMATGRENKNHTHNNIWGDPPSTTPSPANTRQYRRNYSYDKMGNMSQLAHTAHQGSFTRNFSYFKDVNNIDLNTLEKIEDGSSNLLTDFDYDANGNTIQSNTERFYEWNAADQLRFFKIDNGSVSVYAQYRYSAANRVKKYEMDSSGNYTTTVYIDGVFEYQKLVKSGTSYERNYTHIMDDKSRIATVRAGSDEDDIAEDTFYVVENHLNSSTARIKTNGAVLDREEYYPYGETSVRNFSKKRYRFTGKEKDANSGLYYFGARYYSAWCCRFMCVDAKSSSTPNFSPYIYANANPVIYNDPTGNNGEKGNTEENKPEPGFYIQVSDADPNGEQALQDLRESLGEDRYYEDYDFNSSNPLDKKQYERLTMENLGNGLYKVNFFDHGLALKGIRDENPDFEGGNQDLWLMYNLTNGNNSFSYQVTDVAVGSNGSKELYNPNTTIGPVDINFSINSRGVADSTNYIQEKVFEDKLLPLDAAIENWNIFNSKPLNGFDGQAFLPKDLGGIFVSNGSANDQLSRSDAAMHSLAEVYARTALKNKFMPAHKFANKFGNSGGVFSRGNK